MECVIVVIVVVVVVVVAVLLLKKVEKKKTVNIPFDNIIPGNLNSNESRTQDLHVSRMPLPLTNS